HKQEGRLSRAGKQEAGESGLIHRSGLLLALNHRTPTDADALLPRAVLREGFPRARARGPPPRPSGSLRWGYSETNSSTCRDTGCSSRTFLLVSTKEAPNLP
ncbi:hypothetical protein XENOCAPTIV_024843, partial [Xenoophorus captivus]